MKIENEVVMNKHIAFYANGGKGFGHINRILAIANSILKKDESIEITLHSSSINRRLIDNDLIKLCPLPLKIGSEHYKQVIQQKTCNNIEFQEKLIESLKKQKPHIVVFDYLVVPRILFVLSKLGVKTCIILRKQKSFQMKQLEKNYWLHSVDLIIIPHNPNIPFFERNVFQNIEYVGKIHHPNINNTPKKIIRKDFKISSDKLWIIASCGGGGYPNELKQLINALTKTINIIGTQKDNVIISIFSGAFYDYEKTGKTFSSINFHSFNPKLKEFIHAADLFIGFGGYNSVLEVEQSGTKALLLPMPRRRDNQFERVYEVSKKNHFIEICETFTELPDKLIKIINLNINKKLMKTQNQSKQFFTNSNGASKSANLILKLLHNSTPSWEKNYNSAMKVYKNTYQKSVPVIKYFENENLDLISEIRNNLHQGYRGIILKVHNSLSDQEEKKIKTCLEYPRNENLSFFIRVASNNKEKDQKSFQNVITLPRISNDMKELNLRILRYCNSKCVFCNHWRDKKYKNQIMTLDKASDLIRQFSDLNVNKVTFNGGEPTLHPHLSNMIKLCSKLSMIPKVNTNAILLNNDKRSSMLIDSGVKEFLISFHGLEKTTEKIRGIPGSFRRSLEAINMLRKKNHSLKIRINMVITMMNYLEAFDVLTFVVNVGANEANFSLVDNLKDVDNSTIRLGKEEIGKFYFDIVPKLISFGIKYNIRIKVSPMFTEIVELISTNSSSKEKRHLSMLEFLTQNNIKKFQTEINDFSNGYYGKNFYSKYSCKIPSKNAYLMANGDVFPCLRSIGYSNDLILGNIYQQKLDYIRASEAWTKYALNAGKHEVCKTCKNLFEYNIK